MAYKKAKKTRRQIDSAIIHVKSSFNNTLVSVTTMEGDVVMRCSAGRLSFKGSRKGTPFAGSQIGAHLAKEMMTHGIKNLEVNLQGPGAGREAAIRSLQAAGLEVSLIKDVTPIPHNGCRPPKRRRV